MDSELKKKIEHYGVTGISFDFEIILLILDLEFVGENEKISELGKK